MRIRVPGRFIAVLAILTAFLCLLPASTKVAVAKPINWIDVGPTDPNAPTGDNDGVVLKNLSAHSPTVVAAGTGSTVAQKQYAPRGEMRLLFSVARRLDYWLYLLRY